MASVTHLAVEGMTCAACVTRVEKAIGQVDGVRAVSVSLASHSARIEGEAAASALIDAIDADLPPGPVRIAGLVVTRQHPMTARGTVFLALEDETGMANVTLWPRTWERLRGVVRRHALLYVEGTLEREDRVVNVIAGRIEPPPNFTRTIFSCGNYCAGVENKAFACLILGGQATLKSRTACVILRRVLVVSL